MAEYELFFCFLVSLLGLVRSNDILCEQGFCRLYLFETGCANVAVHCGINNATHMGLTLPSPTLCNCCDYCLPFYGEGEHCSSGGPGLGTTVGRCGDGLTCTYNSEGWTTCTRMTTDCHTAQDDYDAREQRGEIGALESRPYCDGKGKYAAFDCIPAHTCFCQSEDGKRLFGEVLNLGATTMLNMHCGCSRFHDRIRRNIAPGVSLPVVGPRCSSDGNFHPIQCLDNICYCVDTVTGTIRENLGSIDLEEKPITELPCYDADEDLFPQYRENDEPPYNFTSPCLIDMQEKIALILKSEEDGFNVDYFSSFPECLPDGTFGRIAVTRNGSKICVDERSRQIEDYEAFPSSTDFNTMDCNCAYTSYIMGSSPEKPVCCKNGNFRTIQCRRGMCRCVDSDGRQTAQESADVTRLPCYTPDWRTC